MPAKSSPSERHSQDAWLHDMLESAQHVLRYVKGVFFEDFGANSEKRDAVALRLSVIGEAARHITKATETALPTIPFKQIRDMRNRITHDYGQVDFRIVWEVAQQDIARLVVALEQHFAPRKINPRGDTDSDATPPGVDR